MTFWERHQYFTFFCAWIPLYVYIGLRIFKRRRAREGKP